MKQTVLILGILFNSLIISAQDYFPIISGSYWLYDVYQNGVYSYQDSVVYNKSAIINDTTFYLFIHNYIEDGTVTEIDTFFHYDNYYDKNSIMLSNRNMPVVDSAIFAKHSYTDGEWWFYNKKPANDTINVKFIGDYTVTSGFYSDCFLQGDEYYFAPNVGIIRITLWNEESYYDLKRYFIPTETAIRKQQLTNFEIFPNPVNEYLIVKGIQNGIYQIFDIKGFIVKSDNFTDSKIDIAELNNGLYILTIQNGGLTKKTRFIKN